MSTMHTDIAILWNADGSIETAEVQSPVDGVGPDRVYRLPHYIPPFRRAGEALDMALVAPPERIYTRMPGLLWSYRELP